jgi:uncharacterized protein (DUF1778 family)
MSVTKKKGRPTRAMAPARNVTVRVTPKERAAWERAAKARGLNLSDWVRLSLHDLRGGR